MPINYELAKKEGPKVKAALTRARKGTYKDVHAACLMAMAHWASWGAWPDNWRIWQGALDDAARKHNLRWASGEVEEMVRAPRLEEL